MQVITLRIQSSFSEVSQAMPAAPSVSLEKRIIIVSAEINPR